LPLVSWCSTPHVPQPGRAAGGILDETGVVLASWNGTDDYFQWSERTKFRSRRVLYNSLWRAGSARIVIQACS